jgi:hypothetical protein
MKVEDVIMEQIVIIPLVNRGRFSFSELNVDQNARRYLPNGYIKTFCQY